MNSNSRLYDYPTKEPDEAVKRKIAELEGLLASLQKQYMSYRESVMQAAYSTTGRADIKNLSKRVAEFEDCIRQATLNTHIGGQQCCDALESVAAKMKKAKKLLFVDN